MGGLLAGLGLGFCGRFGDVAGGLGVDAIGGLCSGCWCFSG